MTESVELIKRPKNKRDFQEDEWKNEIDILLNSAQQCAKNEAKKVQNFIGNEIIKSDLIARKIRRRLTGERYSIFDALGRSDSETSHSLFLRHLLDPMETHDQGTVFLDCFLNTLKSLAKEQNVKFDENLPDDWRGAKSLTEVSHDDGRIDIVIELSNKACIVIENKVWASEQDQQIARYGRWLESKNCRHKILIFLTSTGYCSQTKEGFDVINISYEQLAQLLTLALSKVEPTAIPVLSVVKQYINVCNYIFTGSKIMSHANKEIIELLKNPANFEIAMDIRAYVDEISPIIRSDFTSNVLKLINEKFNSDNAPHKWIAVKYDLWSRYSISIETKLSKYRVIFGNVFHEKSGGRQFGWFGNGEDIDIDSEDVKQLTHSMIDDYSCISSKKWLCYIDGNTQKVQIPTMDMSWDDAETRLAILKDNQKDHSQDRSTLANGLADAMWDIFSRYRVNVEQLKSFRS